ncbi:MAG TPA: invasion associated locus B family protein [Devosia sp.]|nr:invasion associated locus B family protein [Devosia sp.]
MRVFARVAAAIALPFVLSGAALAAAAAPAASPAPQPQSTTAVYGDWTLRCVQVNTPNQPAPQPGQPAQTTKHCELDQAIGVAGQQQPVAQVAVGPDLSGTSIHLVAALPVGAWLPVAPALKVNADAAPVPLSYKRCLPSACFADTALSDDLRAAMSASKTPGVISFQMTEGKESTLPLSFNGFTAAYQALQSAK